MVTLLLPLKEFDLSEKCIKAALVRKVKFMRGFLKLILV
jgi:hypothetical protein